MRAQRLDAVDGLRGIAILMVIFHHVYSDALRKAVAASGSYPWLMSQGFLGVGIFFILSGFVLALPFAIGRSSMESARDLASYYRRRAGRLLPLFLFMATLSLAFTVHASAPQARSYLLVLTTLNMFTDDQFLPTINAPLWSISIEIWASALIPFALIGMRRFGVVPVTVVTALCALAVRSIGAFYSFPNEFLNPVKDSVLGRADDFAIGMAIAILYARGKLPKLGGIWALIGLFCIQIAALAWDVNASMRWAVGLFNIPLQAGAALILVVCLNPASHVAAAISIWPLRVMGAMCFSLYCWHPLLMSGQIVAQPFSPENLLIFWGPLLVLAAMTYRYIEFPHQRLADLLRLQERASAEPLNDVPPERRRPLSSS